MVVCLEAIRAVGPTKQGHSSLHRAISLIAVAGHLDTARRRLSELVLGSAARIKYRWRRDLEAPKLAAHFPRGRTPYNGINHPSPKGSEVYEEHTPPRQAGELRWSLFGVSFRVVPSFWLYAALVAYFILNPFFAGNQLLIGVAIDVGCIFAAIVFTLFVQGLIYRSYGLYSTVIVSDFSSGIYPEAEPPLVLQRIVVALSGPISSFILFAVVFYSNAEFQWAKMSPYAGFAYQILVIISLFWGILGLLPIYPYSCGKVMLEVFAFFAPVKGIILTLVISILIALAYVAYVVGVYFFQVPRLILIDKWPLPAAPIAAIFFGFSILKNVQLLKSVGKSLNHRRSTIA